MRCVLFVPTTTPEILFKCGMWQYNDKKKLQQQYHLFYDYVNIFQISHDLILEIKSFAWTKLTVYRKIDAPPQPLFTLIYWKLICSIHFSLNTLITICCVCVIQYKSTMTKHKDWTVYWCNTQERWQCLSENICIDIECLRLHEWKKTQTPIPKKRK